MKEMTKLFTDPTNTSTPLHTKTPKGLFIADSNGKKHQTPRKPQVDQTRQYLHPRTHEITYKTKIIHRRNGYIRHNNNHARNKSHTQRRESNGNTGQNQKHHKQNNNYEPKQNTHCTNTRSSTPSKHPINHTKQHIEHNTTRNEN